MRKLVTLFALGLVFLFAGCGTSGGGGSGGTTVSMGGTSFAAGTNLSITAGQAVTFDDPTSSGGTHLLVTGTNGTFSAEAGAPSEFASADGISFHPGDSKANHLRYSGHVSHHLPHPPFHAGHHLRLVVGKSGHKGLIIVWPHIQSIALRPEDALSSSIWPACSYLN